MISWLRNNSVYLKSSIIVALGAIAIFIDKDNPWFHWTWLTYVALTSVLLALEFWEHSEKRKTPLQRFRELLLQPNGWRHQNTDDYLTYFESDPDFQIRTDDRNSHLDFSQEWTRGEVGARSDSGNAAYYRVLKYNNTEMARVHIFSFDGGKKTAVAPDWEPISGGRIYYYLEDSIQYAYQQMLVHEMGADHSKGLRNVSGGTEFDIPVFKDEVELETFVAYAGERSPEPSRNTEEQNRVFSVLLQKYTAFKGRST